MKHRVTVEKIASRKEGVVSYSLLKEYAMRRRFVAAKEKLLAKLYQGCSLPANYVAAKLRY